MRCHLVLQDAMYAPYDAEIDFLQDQISVLSDEIVERDKHIESLKSERVSGGYEVAAGYTGRGGSRDSSMAPSEDGAADRDVELQVIGHARYHVISLLQVLSRTQHTFWPSADGADGAAVTSYYRTA